MIVNLEDLQERFHIRIRKSVLWIRTLNPDPNRAFQVKPNPDTDPGFWWSTTLPKTIFDLIEIRTSSNYAMLRTDRGANGAVADDTRTTEDSTSRCRPPGWGTPWGNPDRAGGADPTSRTGGNPDTWSAPLSARTWCNDKISKLISFFWHFCKTSKQEKMREWLLQNQERWLYEKNE